MIPGKNLLAEGTLEFNQSREKVRVDVTNVGDRPVMVGSHFHFFEVNKALKFDRAAYEMRMDKPAGAYTRVESGNEHEIAAIDAAVLNVGGLQAGTKENVISDEATIKLNVRTSLSKVRENVLGAIERIVEAEAEAQDAPKFPEIISIDRYPLTVNAPDTTRRVVKTLKDHFGHDRVEEISAPVPASEDFGSFGAEWHAPSVFWYIGGTDPDACDKARQAGRVAQDIPTNQSPNFAPIIHPTLETGVEAMVVAAQVVIVTMSPRETVSWR